ncbi:MAG: YgiT-type zinc finger protein [Desulfuromonadaceae bacterium]|nr:YgiT-type zinc finger protein [Desulfuromonadaceae bacterium]
MESGEIRPNHEMEWFGNRVRESRYSLSEHVVRYLVEGKVSVQGIENVLMTGRVLEEHRNPVRSTSFLVYGTLGGQPLHVKCAEDVDHQLVVLFAYVPAPPVWDSPTRRNSLGGSEMAESVGTCFFCGGKLIEITVGNYLYRYEGQMCAVKRLPAALCEQCGEKYISAEVGRKLNALIDEKKFSGTEEANVIEFMPEVELS